MSVLGQRFNPLEWHGRRKGFDGMMREAAGGTISGDHKL